MRRTRIGFVVGLAVVALAVAGCGGDDEEAGGTYTIEVDDQADIHNFHLTGAGVDESTDVSAVGTETWEVTFEAGTYEFVCDPHASTMNGSFEVTG